MTTPKCQIKYKNIIFPDCVDRYIECPIWATFGDCVTNPGAMLCDCPVSCRSPLCFGSKYFHTKHNMAKLTPQTDHRCLKIRKNATSDSLFGVSFWWYIFYSSLTVNIISMPAFRKLIME